MPTDMTAERTDGLRRVPKQARARQRVERILDAAETVFTETGYEAATTNQIAARAGTSIGSLYEFFADKPALAAGLGARYVADLGTLYGEHLVNDRAVPGELIVDSVVDALAAFWRRHPGVAPLLRGSLGAPALVEAGEQLRAAFVDRVAAILAARRPEVPAERDRLVAEITFDLTRAVLDRAQAEPLHRRAAVLTELKTALLAYLRASVDRVEG